MHDDLPRHRIGQTQIVGGGHPVNQYAHLVAATDGIDHAAIIRGGLLAGEGIHSGLVIQSSIDATQIIAGDHALERFVHSVAATQVEKIHRRPHFGCRGLVDTLHHL